MRATLICGYKGKYLELEIILVKENGSNRFSCRDFDHSSHGWLARFIVPGMHSPLVIVVVPRLYVPRLYGWIAEISQGLIPK